MRARGMSPAAAAKKRLGVVAGGGGFGLGCGCRDAKAVAVAVAASSSATSPYSATATDTSTATTWRRGRAAALHPSSASGSTGTLTVPSASSSSFLWEDDADDGDAGEEEVDCSKQRESSAAATTSFSGLLRQLNELEQSVVSWGRKSTSKEHFSPPPPPPPPPPPVKQRVVHSSDQNKEGHGNFSPPPPPPPPLPARPAKQQVLQSGGDDDSKEGNGNFSPPPPSPFELQTTQQNRKTKNIDKAVRQAGEVHSKQPPPSPPLPLAPEQLKAASTGKSSKKEADASMFPTSQVPKHRKAKSGDGGAGGTGRLDGTVLAVVKQSDDPLSDFRRSMVNMIVENRIATGDELRELLRHFLALNAPHHHDAILRAFTEIWDEAFSAAAKAPHRHREPVSVSVRRPTPPRPRPTPPLRRHSPPPRVWR